MAVPTPSDQKWSRTITADAGQTSDPLYVPNFVSAITALVEPGGGGNATLQYTTADADDIEANPANVPWITWEDGAVTAPTAKESNGSITAVRLLAATAAGTLFVSGTKG